MALAVRTSVGQGHQSTTAKIQSCSACDPRVCCLVSLRLLFYFQIWDSRKRVCILYSTPVSM
ncbi:hypothetical protein SCLCIDRAFT_1213391 [Scleroderma citrinum Foug A]|uniref:Uncharacterized protein n=1 Tax=Scleroderma citrinum Foug A TaxID=1036808 RepID=A0A0C3E780_9AGAM|nr:hypothetical protein SCLCIDRAFT_1213391 [Scleroderma citrinum Foug A]